MAEQPDRQRSQLETAVTLIVVGVLLLIAQLTNQWTWVVLVLGLIFLTAYFLTRRYGWLVPGGILTGVGVGILLSNGSQDTNETTGMLFLISLGSGFILIWLLDLLFMRASNWWPLIPGGIMVLIGVLMAAGDAGERFLQLLNTGWPVILILAGIWILFGVWRRGGARQ